MAESVDSADAPADVTINGRELTNKEYKEFMAEYNSKKAAEGRETAQAKRRAEEEERRLAAPANVSMNGKELTNKQYEEYLKKQNT